MTGRRRGIIAHWRSGAACELSPSGSPRRTVECQPLRVAHPTPPVRAPPVPQPGSAIAPSSPEGESAGPPQGQSGQEETKSGTLGVRPRDSGKGGRGTPDAWLAQSARSSRNRFGRSGSGSTANGVVRDRAAVSTSRSTASCAAATVVKIRIGELISGGRVRTRAMVVRRKTGRPVQFELLEPARVQPPRLGSERRGGALDDYGFPSRTDHANSHRAPASTRGSWTSGSQAIGLRREDYGTHSLRRTKASIIYKAHRQLAGGPAAPGAYEDREHGALSRGGRRGRAHPRRAHRGMKLGGLRIIACSPPAPKPTFAKDANGAKCELMRDFAGRGCAIYR